MDVVFSVVLPVVLSTLKICLRIWHSLRGGSKGARWLFRAGSIPPGSTEEFLLGLKGSAVFVYLDT